MEFRLTISYARFDSSFQAPDDVNTTECDLCVNTIYVQPDHSKLFECRKNAANINELGVWGMIYTNREGFTTLGFKNVYEKTFTSGDYVAKISSNLSGTPRGMMCKYFSVSKKYVGNKNCKNSENENLITFWRRNRYALF